MRQEVSPLLIFKHIIDTIFEFEYNGYFVIEMSDDIDINWV